MHTEVKSQTVQKSVTKRAYVLLTHPQILPFIGPPIQFLQSLLLIRISMFPIDILTLQTFRITQFRHYLFSFFVGKKNLILSPITHPVSSSSLLPIPSTPQWLLSRLEIPDPTWANPCLPHWPQGTVHPLPTTPRHSPSPSPSERPNSFLPWGICVLTFSLILAPISNPKHLFSYLFCIWMCILLFHSVAFFINWP